MTWIQRITLILFITVVGNWVVTSTTGYSLLGGDVFTLLLVIFLILLTLTLLRPLTRRILWRVRNRLFVTYFLVGALPVALLLLIGAFLFYALTGSTVAYLAHSELNRRIDDLQDTARQLAEDIQTGRRTLSTEGLSSHAVVRSGTQTVSTPGPIQEIPSWSRPGFKGIVRTDENEYFLAAQAQSGGQKRLEVFTYRSFDDKSLATVVGDIARLRMFRLRDFGTESIEDAKTDVDIRPVLDSARVDKGLNFNFGALSGFPLPDVWTLDSGEHENHFLSVVARPSFVVNRILSPFGSFVSTLIIGVLVVVGILLAVELAAVLSSAKLTRTLTRTVHDLYTGTKKVEAGDFAHRIPVRTKDQLSELATSFNSMTERVEKLIEEVKEKEKLEAELEIARHVQSQLFPKEVPRLKTLELTGVCNPARVVSGDYYDFIPFNARSTALVIGDISGKGISAALLMASVQSSLHAQLKSTGSGIISTATLVGQLNRQLFENTPPEKYATFYCGFYDDDDGRLSYTNAGHLAPILIRHREVIRLESNGMAVGLFPESPYEQNVVDLKPGDLLMAFTDGITESESAKGEQFGEDRLTDLLIQHRDRPLDEIVRIVIDAVCNWASDLDNQDDTTLLLARRL